MLWLAATKINSLHLKSTKKHAHHTQHTHACSCSVVHLSIFHFCHAFLFPCICVFQFSNFAILSSSVFPFENCMETASAWCGVVWNSSLYVTRILRPNTYKLYVQRTLNPAFLLHFHRNPLTEIFVFILP